MMATSAAHAHGQRATGASAFSAENDSEMAPQAIEIAKNGLDHPPARSGRDEESMSGIPYGAKKRDWRRVRDAGSLVALSRRARAFPECQMDGALLAPELVQQKLRESAAKPLG
jgi:hypothetical protein